jgi:hypothetical protein
VALIALFWIAQIQAAVHGISHLQFRAELHDQTQPHSLLCTDCVGYSQAGAAPITEHKPPPFLVGAGTIAVSRIIQRIERAPTLAFRSRAPPSTSI